MDAEEVERDIEMDMPYNGVVSWVGGSILVLLSQDNPEKGRN